MTGASLEGLKDAIGQLAVVDWGDVYAELGVHKRLGLSLRRDPRGGLNRPRIEILILMLTRYPQFSIAAETSVAERAVESYLEKRDVTQDGCRDVFDRLVGRRLQGSSKVNRWGAPRSVGRVLRLAHKGLSQPHSDDCDEFFRFFRECASLVDDPRGVEAGRLTGEDMVTLRNRLGGISSTWESFCTELGLDPNTSEALRRDPRAPLNRPALELLIRLLTRYPHWSIFGEAETLLSDVMDSLNSVHPGEQYGARDLSVLLGYEISASYSWEGGVPPMTLQVCRCLSFLRKGLTQSSRGDRERFIEDYMAAVATVAAQHGISDHDLRRRGFYGFRSRRRQRDRTMAISDAPE